MAMGEYTSVRTQNEQVGGLASLATTVPWWLSSIRQLAFGAIAAGATYLVGLVLGVSVVG